jgi:hypothetical protein
MGVTGDNVYGDEVTCSHQLTGQRSRLSVVLGCAPQMPGGCGVGGCGEMGTGEGVMGNAGEDGDQDHFDARLRLRLRSDARRWVECTRLVSNEGARTPSTPKRMCEQQDERAGRDTGESIGC